MVTLAMALLRYLEDCPFLEDSIQRICHLQLLPKRTVKYRQLGDEHECARVFQQLQLPRFVRKYGILVCKGSSLDSSSTVVGSACHLVPCVHVEHVF